MSNVTSESLEKTSKNRHSSARCCCHIILLQPLLPLPSSRLQLLSTLGHAASPHQNIPNFVPKRRRKMHGKNVYNVTSESLEKASKNRQNRHSFLLQLLLPLLSSKRKTSKNRHSSAPAAATTLSCSSRCCHCQAPGFSNSQALATRLRHIKTPPDFVPKLLLQVLLPLPSSKLQLRASPHTSFVPKGQAPDFSSQPLATRLRHTKTPPNFVPKRRPKMHGKNV